MLDKYPRTVAIVTARGGSKGLPRKNLRDLAGKPLIAYSIEAALECPYISSCLVTTEDEKIKEVSLQWGAQIIDRPPELASDTALHQDVIKHALRDLDEKEGLPPYFVLLQPTSPLRTAQHLSQCLESFFLSNASCAVSISEVEHHPYKTLKWEEDELKPLFGLQDLDKPRQLLPKIAAPNGAIYVMPSQLFLDKSSFFVPPVFPYYMSRWDSVDIDDEFDLFICSQVLQYNKLLKTSDGMISGKC